MKKLQYSQKSLSKLEDSLQYKFNDLSLLEIALTHKSFSANNNYQRLEFLGDSVLNIVITKYLFIKYKNDKEGELTKKRISLVKGTRLASFARNISLQDYIIMGEYENSTGTFNYNSVLEDVFEAVLGAIFLDSGGMNLDSVERVIILLVCKQEDTILEDASVGIHTIKNTIQEILQANNIDVPTYSMVSCIGNSPEQLFTSSCKIVSLGLEAQGEGKNKKESESNAAQAMLALMRNYYLENQDKYQDSSKRLKFWPKNM